MQVASYFAENFLPAKICCQHKCIIFTLVASRLWSTHLDGFHLWKTGAHVFYVTYACVMCSLHWNHLLLYCLCLGELCQFYFSLSYLLPQADLIPGVPRLWIGIVRPRCALHRRVSAVWQDWNWNHFLWYGLMCALYVSAPSQANNRKTQYKLSIVMEIFFFLCCACGAENPLLLCLHTNLGAEVHTAEENIPLWHC